MAPHWPFFAPQIFYPIVIIAYKNSLFGKMTHFQGYFWEKPERWVKVVK